MGNRYLDRVRSGLYISVAVPKKTSAALGRMEIAVAWSRVHAFLRVSPTGLAETSSLTYGLVIHLRLLPTLSRENAVTNVGYRPVTIA